LKYIKKLNIDFDQWVELKDNYNIKLFIEDKEDKYALYLNQEQYYNIFLPYIKENNIKLYWNGLNKNILDSNLSIFSNKNNIILYKLKENNYQLTYSGLNYFNKIFKNKIKILKINEIY